MFFKPAILSLFTGSLLISGMLVYAAAFGLQILRNWDLRSGSERQLRLERKTYLISTVVAYAFAFHLVSFFLFIATADRLHPRKARFDRIGGRFVQTQRFAGVSLVVARAQGRN